MVHPPILNKQDRRLPPYKIAQGPGQLSIWHRSICRRRPGILRLVPSLGPIARRDAIHAILQLTRPLPCYGSKDRITVTSLGDTHEYPLFQTHRLRGRCRHEQPHHGRRWISIRAAVAPEPCSCC